MVIFWNGILHHIETEADERIVLWSENMNEWIVARINSLKEDLSKKQEYFKINIQNMDSPTYEDNTINDLLVMKKLKTEIEQLELLLQLNGIFAQDNAMENLLREVGNLQSNFQKLCRSNKVSKKAICNLVIPFRDKYNLTDLQALQIARNELSVAEIADLLLQNDGFKEVI